MLVDTQLEMLLNRYFDEKFLPKQILFEIKYKIE